MYVILTLAMSITMSLYMTMSMTKSKSKSIAIRKPASQMTESDGHSICWLH